MSEADTPTEPRELFRYAIENGLDAENRAVVDELFADTIEVLQPDGPDTMTPEQIWQQHQVERAAMPDYTHDIQQVFEDGGMVFAQYTAEATFENEFVFGPETTFEPTGETIDTAGIMQARVEDGQITGWGAFWNKLDLFQQAGIVPPMEELAD